MSCKFECHTHLNSRTSQEASVDPSLVLTFLTRATTSVAHLYNLLKSCTVSSALSTGHVKHESPRPTWTRISCLSRFIQITGCTSREKRCVQSAAVSLCIPLLFRPAVTVSVACSEFSGTHDARPDPSPGRQRQYNIASFQWYLARSVTDFCSEI